jgi:hypothetical protein
MSTLASGRASSASRPAASAISKDLLGAEINFCTKMPLKKLEKILTIYFFCDLTSNPNRHRMRPSG